MDYSAIQKALIDEIHEDLVEGSISGSILSGVNMLHEKLISPVKNLRHLLPEVLHAHLLVPLVLFHALQIVTLKSSSLPICLRT